MSPTKKKCSNCGQKGHNKRTCKKETTVIASKRGAEEDNIQPTRESTPPVEITPELPSELPPAIPSVEDHNNLIQKPLGLSNPPDFNCCFMNSTLQLLRSVKEFVNYFLSGDAALVYELKQNVNIAKEFNVLLGSWKSNHQLEQAHRLFRKKCGELNPIWCNEEQQDAAHFLLFLLEMLDTDLLLEDGTSIIQELFQGKMCYYRRCKLCDRIHQKEDFFRTLDLSLVGFTADTSISALLARFTAKTDDGNQSRCDNCLVDVDTDTYIKIIQYPKVLLMCLKIYVVENANGINNVTKFDREVRFDALKITDVLDYNIKSLVSHYGDNLNTGHYKAFVSFGGSFVEYSDRTITVYDTVVFSRECYLLAYQASHQDISLLLAEFQWLENRRISLAQNQEKQLERSNTQPLVAEIHSNTQGLHRHSSTETIKILSQKSIDNGLSPKALDRNESCETIQPFSQQKSFDRQSSIENYSQENREAAVGRWYEKVGWEDEDIDYNEFWEDYHHLDVQVCFIKFFLSKTILIH